MPRKTPVAKKADRSRWRVVFGGKRGHSVFSFWRDDQHLDSLEDLAVGRVRVQLFKLLRHSCPAKGDVEQRLARIRISRADRADDAVMRMLTIIPRAIRGSIIPDHLLTWVHCAAQRAVTPNKLGKRLVPVFDERGEAAPGP